VLTPPTFCIYSWPPLELSAQNGANGNGESCPCLLCSRGCTICPDPRWAPQSTWSVRVAWPLGHSWRSELAE